MMNKIAYTQILNIRITRFSLFLILIKVKKIINKIHQKIRARKNNFLLRLILLSLMNEYYIPKLLSCHYKI